MKCSLLHYIDMEKIAIFGGSFDPPHKGHKLLALNLAEKCGADKVLIMPTALSPFKERSGAESSDRLEMCRLLFNEPIFEISDIETRRGGKSYTIDTLNEVKKLYSKSQLYLFMGDDMFLSLDRWYKYKEILELCVPVAACRTEKLEKLDDMRKFAQEVLGLSQNGAIICESVPIETSSTQIRRDLKKGVYNHYLDEKVLAYIKDRGLYI